MTLNQTYRLNLKGNPAEADEVEKGGIYPLRFRSIFKETPWGGNRLKEVFGKDTPQGKKIGESWEIVDREDYNSTVTNGPYQGITLHELMLYQPAGLLGGSHKRQTRFPLLVKFIDITGRLSLQVHPDDTYAKTREKDSGKAEAWYVIRSEPGSWIVHGLKEGISIESFEQYLREGDKKEIEACLNFVSVKSGDIIFIPPGTLHAAGDGLLLLEVQQNSDLTYRVYDWNNGRPLQLEKALEVIRSNPPVRGSVRSASGGLARATQGRTLLLECDKFVMELLEVEEVHEEKASGLNILTFISGNADIYYGKSGHLEASAGDNLLIPAGLKGYQIRPRSACKLVVTSLPKETL
jgi:mannose-6-phosphate isomerase